ncbi:MAG: 50S ribosomal protein L33 [Clostridium sp.]|nr:50S ribosomal protein L33 [Clostridium sp.]
MAEARTEITLVCSKCKNENYISTKNKKSTPERIKKNKFCPKCNAKTEHVEKK